MTRGLRLLALSLPLSLLCLLVSFASASAQYMYVDTNGDGVHSAADVIQPTGTTTLDLWLKTDAGRDGTPATCDTGDGELTVNGYEFILHATNGTVAWGAVTNRAAAFTSAVPVASDNTDLHAGAYGATLPPGLYRLASVEVAPASGTPAIEIATSSAIAGATFTGFGSQCSGYDFSNTLTLGVDWFDTDGAAYGGAANSAPVLDPIPDLYVQETATLEQALVAHDADGNPLEFTKVSGPSFMAVTTVDPGAGVASGLIRLTPGYSDAGSTIASVQASDQIVASSASFRVTVQDKDRAPTMLQPDDMFVLIGDVRRQNLYATDPDGGQLHFSMVSGPSFITVTTTEPFSPATGIVTLMPGEYDAGNTHVVVAASDGELQAERTFAVNVVRAFGTGTLLCRPYDMTVVAGSQAEQVLMVTSLVDDPVTFSLVDAPPFASVTPENATTTPQTALLRVAPSASDLGVHSVTVDANYGPGSVRETCRITVVSQLTPQVPKPDLLTSAFRSYDVCDIPQGAVLADLNRDGRLDLVTPNYGCGVSVLLGIGAGKFGDRTDVHLDGNPKGVSLADLDGDGDLDAAVSIGYGDQIAILAGDGRGGFTQVGALPAGPDAAYPAIADLNGDGILDVAGADEEGNSISVYLGTGGMSFGERRTYQAGSAPCYIEVADYNGDGILDAAAANENSDALTLHIGRGDGTFAPAAYLGTAAGPSSVRSGDFDEDGNLDLAASAFHTHFLTVLFGDGHGAFSRRVDLDTGNNPWSLTTTDVNGDGHLDLVSADTGDDDLGIILGHGNGTFAAALRSATGSVPRFVAGGDLDGDHRTDLVVAHENGGTVGVLMGHGDGTFGASETLGRQPSMDLAVGDVTGDGLADAVSVLRNPQVVEVRAGLGHGQFAPPITLSTGYSPIAVKLADMNGDGIADLLVSLQTDSWVLYFGGAALHAPPIMVGAGGRAFHIEAGDWNGDGKQDVALTSAPNQRVTLLDGDGAGGFTNRRDIQLSGPTAELTTGDWDGDGIADLAVDLGARGTAVLWGDGVGFIPGPILPVFENAIGSTSGDLDGDGRAELVVMEEGSHGGILEFQKGPHGRVAIYKWSTRDAAPTRTVYPAGSRPGTASIADVTGDGRPDLVIPELGAGAIGVLPGLPGGAFDARQDYGTGGGPVVVSAVADVDGDGRLDVLAANFGTLLTATTNRTLSILRNLGAAATPPLDARAFVAPGDRTIRLVAAKPTVCVYLEPVDRSFALTDVDPGSIRMSRTDSNADAIAATTSKGAALGDADKNGIADLAACFARDGLRALFADVRGARDVPVIVTGSLVSGVSGATGRSFRADLVLHVVAGPNRPPLVSVSPNPFNPTGLLRFTLETAGRVRVIVYDVRGRTVARVYESKAAPVGELRIPLGHGAPGGADLASGIYFYRVETPDGISTGRFAVLK